VSAVTHPDGPDANGKTFEVGAGYVAEIRWERSPGAVFKTDTSFTPSAVSSNKLVRDARANAEHLGESAMGGSYRLLQAYTVSW
jgi:multifunctional beta-oxidation protein